MRRSAAIMLVGLALVAGSCSDDAAPEPATTTTQAASVVVPANPEAGIFIVNVTLTDSGYDPEMVFVPAGHSIHMVLRNRGEQEHHYRAVGLIPTDMRWLRRPDIDDYDMATSEEFANVYEDDVEHVLHHLKPSYVPFKEESPAGIKPLPNEVHGYAAAGGNEVLSFYALETGEYEVVDVLHPEINGTIVVFDPRPGATSGS